MAQLRLWSCIIDGEAVACCEDGIVSFDRIRYRHHDASVFLYAFDLIELNGDDLRRDPLAVRKATLASLIAGAAPGLRLSPGQRDRAGLLSGLRLFSTDTLSIRRCRAPNQTLSRTL
jgi:ATP-dependent DNA ligase